MSTASAGSRAFEDDERPLSDAEYSPSAPRWLGAVFLTAWTATWAAILITMYVTEPSYVVGFRDTDITVTCRALSGPTSYPGSLDTAGLVTNPGGADAVVQELYDEDETTLEDVYNAYFDEVRRFKEHTAASETTPPSLAAWDDYWSYRSRLQQLTTGCELERTARTGQLGMRLAVALSGIVLIGGTMLVRRTQAPSQRARRHLQRGLSIITVLVGLGAIVTVHTVWSTNPTLTVGDGGPDTVELTCLGLSDTRDSFDFSNGYLTTLSPRQYSDAAGLDSLISDWELTWNVVASFAYYDGEPDTAHMEAWQTEEKAMAATQTACGARRDEQLATLNLTLGLSVIALMLLQGGIIFTRLRPTDGAKPPDASGPCDTQGAAARDLD